MTSILVVDDERVFRDNRKSQYIRHPDEAVEYLQTNPIVDELYLDHDLGEQNGEPITVKPFVSYLEELAYNETPYPFGKIFIITMNYADGGGANWIDAALRRYPNVTKARPLDVGLIKLEDSRLHRQNNA